MNGADSVINRITEEADSIIAANIEAAERRAREISDKAMVDADKLISSAKENEELIRKDIIARRATVANIDARKIVLSAKAERIAAAYDMAKEEIVKSPAYKGFIENMLTEYAEDGDEVIIAQRDKDIITSALIGKISKAKSISLSLSAEYGDFIGGFILSSASCDKNITVDGLVDGIKRETERQIAETLFGDE